MTFASTSQSAEANLSGMIAKAKSEYGILYLDIENAAWVWDKYTAAPYSQPAGATTDDLEYERIRTAVLAKAIDPNVLVGTYWPRKDLRLDGVFDVARYARQQTGVDPFGDTPGLVDAVDFISMAVYQSTAAETWPGYLNAMRDVQSLMPYWADVPHVHLLQNTNFYKGAETDFQPYDLLLQKIEWYQDNLDPPLAGFSFATFQVSSVFDPNHPYARIVRDLGIRDLPAVAADTYFDDLVDARDQMAANLVASTASAMPRTSIDSAKVNWPGTLGQVRIPGVPL